MSKTRLPYSPEFRRQMVDLVRAGCDPEELAREFEPTSQSIRNWVGQAGLREGRREERGDALAARHPATNRRQHSPPQVHRKRHGHA
jgi:transposase